MRRRTPSPRELVATLLACAESEESDQELEQLLVAHAPSLADALGTDVEELERVRGLDAETRVTHLRAVARRARERGQAAHGEAMRNLSLAAAAMLAELACWREEKVELDASILLGNLLADSTPKYVRFDAEGLEPVIVRRAKLREAGNVLRFSDLGASLDRSGLRFHWRGGVGGLFLMSQEIERKDRDAVLHVVLSRPRPRAVDLPVLELPKLRRAPAWMSDVLDALGPL
jgi:hypothetical protein